MQYNIGDWVIVRTDLDVLRKYAMINGRWSIGVDSIMLKRRGELVQIRGVIGENWYLITGDDIHGWTDEMFIPADELPESDVSLHKLLF